MRFCYQCGQPLENKIPPGDNRLRDVCNNSDCGFIQYHNPKIIVGTLPVWNDKVLLCKRAIEPRKGYWTLPAGFMENEETTEQGASRETFEEAQAQVSLQQLYRVYDLPHISQVYIFYLAQLDQPIYSAGEESLEVELFAEDQIPWSDMAFKVMRDILQDYFSERIAHEFTIQNKTLVSSKRY